MSHTNGSQKRTTTSMHTMSAALRMLLACLEGTCMQGLTDRHAFSQEVLSASIRCPEDSFMVHVTCCAHVQHDMAEAQSATLECSVVKTAVCEKRQTLTSPRDSETCNMQHGNTTASCTQAISSSRSQHTAIKNPSLNSMHGRP
jgi:hypothetical protein